MFLIESFEKYNFFSNWIWSEESLLHLIGIILDHSVCSTDNCLSRAVVLLEIDDLCFWIVLLEWENILDICSSPTIDSLPVIADDTEISRRTRENANYFILEEIGILIFIDHEVLESWMEILYNLINIENLSKEEEKVIEIKCIFFFESSDIFLVYFEDNGLDIGVDCRRIFTWWESFPFCLRDHSMDCTRIEFFLIDILTFHDFFRETNAVISIIDHKIFSIAKSIDEHTKKECGRRVKCSDHWKPRFSKRIDSFWIDVKLLCDTIAHFPGGFIGECDTENCTRLDSFLSDHRDDSLSDGMSLSWSCSGINKEWSSECIDGFELLGIELWHGR